MELKYDMLRSLTAKAMARDIPATRDKAYVAVGQILDALGEYAALSGDDSHRQLDAMGDLSSADVALGPEREPDFHGPVREAVQRARDARNEMIRHFEPSGWADRV